MDPIALVGDKVLYLGHEQVLFVIAVLWAGAYLLKSLILPAKRGRKNAR